MVGTAIDTSKRTQLPNPPSGFTDDVIPQLLAWRKERIPSALVTLVSIDGSSPRPLGAQMAVTTTGQYIGQISSGCAEQAIIEQARLLIDDRRDDCLRYGKGSKFVDVVLPCGSGIDILFSPTVETKTLESLNDAAKARSPIDLNINLTSFAHTTTHASPTDEASPHLATTAYATPGNLTKRFCPKIRLLVFGRGPMVAAFTQFANALEFETHVLAPDAETLNEASNSKATSLTQLTTPHALPDLPTDRWTAAVLLFHDHDWEPQILQVLLRTPCFYLGALGSRRTHETRLELLRDLGCNTDELARINGPAGIDIAAQTPTEIAMSIVAQILHYVRTDAETTA